ncbi:MAG: HAD family hydrolase [Oligoflexia bacterium]|nr:HAD family hydrolase [Oligoflexia bacterium]
MSRLLVLDFDGTMTDAEREGAPFRTGYLDDLSKLTGLDRAEIETQAQRHERQVAADPQRYGWIFGGHIVAPATVDPYLRMMPVARKILDDAGVFMAEPDRTRLLDDILYPYNYQKTANVFRKGAGDVLATLSDTADLHTVIVTNSQTRAVQAKLRDLSGPQGRLDKLVDRVHGHAKKYVIDDAWTGVPPHLDLPGLRRPVLLRRRLYHDVLKTLLDQQGLDWTDLVVIGDIFELDLSLPWALGARVGLLANDHTPAYERAFLDATPRAMVLSSLDQIAGLALA